MKDAPLMNAYVSTPRGEGPFPAIILFHDAFGVNINIRNVADKLASDGYLVVAPEMFHRTAAPGFEARYYQVSVVMPHTKALKSEQIADDIQSVYKWLTKQDNVDENKIGAVGFSMGGRMSFVANSLLNLAASVSFYGTSTDKEVEKAATQNGPSLFVWAAKDDTVSHAQVDKILEAMRAADKDFVNIEISKAGHGFFFDSHPGYDAQAARETWSMVSAFLKNKLQS